MRQDHGKQEHDDTGLVAARQALGPLARMGIDADLVGLEPDPEPGRGDTVRAVGVASVPPRASVPPPVPVPPSSLAPPGVLPIPMSPPSVLPVPFGFPPPSRVPSPPSVLPLPIRLPPSSPVFSRQSLQAAVFPPPPPTAPTPSGSPVFVGPSAGTGPVRLGGLSQVDDSPVIPAAWRRTIRAVARGLVEPRAAVGIDRERRLVERIRARQPAPRVIAFVAGKGGLGTTTTAIAVALTLDALRRDRTAVVDGRHGTASIGRRLAGHPASTTAELTDSRVRVATVEPTLVNGSLGVVDGSPWHERPPGDEFELMLGLLGEQFTFAVVDLGNDVGKVGARVLHRADRVVVVAAPAHDAVAAAGETLARVRALNPDRPANAVVAFVCAGTSVYARRRAARRAAHEVGLRDDRIVVVPYDPYLASGRAIDPAGLRAATREAYLRLGALLADPEPPGAGR